ncbi:MAG: chain length determinant protein EpsF [Burkholderiales bacterium]|nr:chain length determinant protein EpsF [Burkholderiales bacterium]MBH2015042.1 chain length determinant protein EpsF [Burkholderiales bacterium]
MSFEQLIAVLRARWAIALATFVLISGTVAVLTLLAPKTYTATGSVVLDIKNPDPIAGMVTGAVGTPSYLMTQIDIMTSSRVGLKVVKNLNLASNSVMKARWQDATAGTGDFELWMADLFRKGIEARPSRGSNVIYLSYKAPDPVFAANIVNAFVEAYLETSVEMRTTPAKQFNAQFDTNARALRQSVEEAQARLSAFQQQEGLIVTDERLDIETARLNELSSQLVGMQAAMADSGSRQVAARTNADQSPDVISNPLVSGLKADILRQEASLEQMRTRLGEQHPQVIEVKTNINDLRSKLNQEIGRVTGSLGINNNVNTSRASQIRASLDEQRAKVLKLKSIRDEAAILQREVDVAQRALDGVTARLQSASLESQAQQNNVTALEYARAPATPSGPRVFSNVMLGTAAAFVVALMLTLIIEFRDRRLRTLSEVEPLFNQPVIGVIPSFKKPSRLSELSSRLSLSKKPPVRALTMNG